MARAEKLPFRLPLPRPLSAWANAHFQAITACISVFWPSAPAPAPPPASHYQRTLITGCPFLKSLVGGTVPASCPRKFPKSHLAISTPAVTDE
uniref:HDC16817 n=1 Tax=Drosophila melanogaster TaxID=7227 RepID=Q6IIW4_DROME|nr:TPA_inf: HDC16817 [Drosophila melanogaster]